MSKETLAQYIADTGELVQKHVSGAMWLTWGQTPAAREVQKRLYHLSDYVVSSLSAGTIWLVERNPTPQPLPTPPYTAYIKQRGAIVGKGVADTSTDAYRLAEQNAVENGRAETGYADLYIVDSCGVVDTDEIIVL